MSLLGKAMLLGVVTGLVGAFINLFPHGTELEEAFGLDFLFSLRGSRNAPPNVIIVAIDRASAAALNLSNNPEKWPRAVHARLTERLFLAGASVIAFDVIFDEPRSDSEDAAFASAIANAGNVLLAESLARETIGNHGDNAQGLTIERLVTPIPLLSYNALAHAPFPLPKYPSKVSRYWTFRPSAGNIPTMPVVAFQIHALSTYEDFIKILTSASPQYAVQLPQSRAEILKEGSLERLVSQIREILEHDPEIAQRMTLQLRGFAGASLDQKKKILLTAMIDLYRDADTRYLNFYGPPRTIPTVSYYQLLNDRPGSSQLSQPLDLTGKAVFIGLSDRSSTDQKDGFQTAYTSASEGDMSGVEIAATAFANMLDRKPVRPIGPWMHIVVLMLWGVTLGISCRLLPMAISFAGTVFLCSAYLAIAVYLFNTDGWWSPVVAPLLIQAPVALFGGMLWRYVDASRERENIRKAFGHYLPEKIVDRLAHNLRDMKTTHQTVHGVFIYTDAVGYTSVAEGISPLELLDYMNRYYENVFEPVRQSEGIVLDMVGDSVLSILVGPDSDQELFTRACAAALAMIQAASHFNSTEKHKMGLRIGVHSGEVLLAPMAAAGHYEYRPFGDIVNTAARLESLSKHLGTMILLSHNVVSHSTGIVTREVGEFMLQGKSTSVVVYELLGLSTSIDGMWRSVCDLFAEALSAFRLGDWDEATEKFEGVRRLRGSDGPSEFYIRLCESFKSSPPGGEWKGVVQMSQK